MNKILKLISENIDVISVDIQLRDGSNIVLNFNTPEEIQGFLNQFEEQETNYIPIFPMTPDPGPYQPWDPNTPSTPYQPWNPNNPYTPWYTTSTGDPISVKNGNPTVTEIKIKKD